MRRSVVAVAAALMLVAATWHLNLVSALPGKDEVVTAPPAKLVLTFSDKVNVKLSAVSVLGADSREVAKLALRMGAKPTMLEGDLGARLPAGRYTVRWRTAGADGHAIRGSYAFSINPVE